MTGKKITGQQKKELSDAINNALGWKVDWTKLKSDDLIFVAEYLTDMAKLAKSRVQVLVGDATENIFNMGKQRVMDIVSGAMNNFQGGQKKQT